MCTTDLHPCPELQKGHDHNRLNEVQRLLKLSNFSEEEHRRQWNEHCQALDRDDQLTAEIFQQMRGPELESFRAGKHYQSWTKSEQSHLLVLSGYNNSNVGMHQCWLSPIAAAAVKDLDQQKVRPLYAYYALPRSGKLLFDVVAVLLLQLLRQKSDALRNEERHAELRGELGKFGEKEMDENDKASALEKVALRVMELFDRSETLYIVVDRADRCRDWKQKDHRRMLLRVFIRMVESAQCRLKVLAVVDGHSWRVEAYQDKLGAKLQDRFIVHTAEQGTIY